MKLAKTRWNVGGFARYKWRPRVSLKLAFDYFGNEIKFGFQLKNEDAKALLKFIKNKTGI